MLITRPRFPLSSTEFTRALATGHGRAIEHVARFGAGGLEPAIIAACVRSLSYDPQCEAARAPWLATLVARAKLEPEVTDAIAALLHLPPDEDQCDLDQRSAILKELASCGSETAHRLLYLSLQRLTHSAGVVGAENIVALDGEPGLIHVARELGRWLKDDPHFWSCDRIIAQFDEAAGAGCGVAVLEREAMHDADIARYLDDLRAQNEASNRRVPHDVGACSGAEIVAHYKRKPQDQCHWFRRWGADAPSDQTAIVFAALLASDDPEHVKRLFRCFAKTGVPRFDERLLTWLRPCDQQLRSSAVNALAHLAHPHIRQAGIQLIAEGDVGHGLALLVNNFEAGDFSMFTVDLLRRADLDDAHGVLFDLLELCQAHAGDEARDCLIHVYEHSPCSSCRKQAVEAMVNANTAPPWLLAEAVFDAEPHTRALAASGGAMQG